MTDAKQIIADQIIDPHERLGEVKLDRAQLLAIVAGLLVPEDDKKAPSCGAGINVDIAVCSVSLARAIIAEAERLVET